MKITSGKSVPARVLIKIINFLLLLFLFFRRRNCSLLNPILQDKDNKKVKLILDN